MILLGTLVAATLAWGSILAGQTTPAGDAEVRRTLDRARDAIAAYTAAGGAPGTADHPAIKWDAELWVYRGRYPGSEAATRATTEAVRLLVRAELWDRAQERVDSVEADDPAWERLPGVLYEAAIARKDLPSAIERISRVVSATTNARIKSSALLVVGRAYRRQGNIDAASRSFEAAKAAAPDAPYAQEADGLLYEVKHLSPGLPAPEISGTARSGRPVTLAGFRGKAVVLVFWGTT
jgi:hypothetical protein